MRKETKMNKSVAKNYVYNVIYQVLVMILPLITTPYVSRILGAEGIGIYSYTISIATYFILFGSLGVAMYAQREIAYVQEDKQKRSKIFWEVFILRAITITISIVLYYFIYANHTEYAIYYRILLIEIIANIFDVSAFFQGMEEFKKIISRNLIVKIISIISIFVFIKTESDVWKYLLIYALSTLIGNLSLWLYLPRYIKKVKLRELNILQHIRPTIVLFIPQIATQVYTVLDKTMIGTMIQDKSEVGYYEQAQKIVKVVLTIITSLGAVMLPRIANKFANGKESDIKENIKNSFNFIYLLAIPMMFGIMAIARDFIPIFLGQGYEKSIILTCVISPILLFIGLSNVVGTQYLLPTKRQKQYTISVIIGAIINLILNFILIPRYLSVGAAIATVMAEFLVAATQFFMIRREFEIKDIIKMSINYLIAGIVMLVVDSILTRFVLVDIRRLIKVIIQVMSGIIVYFGILFILNDNYTKYIFGRVIEPIKKKILKDD